ncbi:MAG: hypothetical protein ABL966_14985, partial [Acidimicrobiales bacterium]
QSVVERSEVRVDGGLLIEAAQEDHGIALIAVPLNAVFGVVAALILVRRRVPGRGWATDA